MALNEQKRAELKVIVQKMIDAKESEANIKSVIQRFSEMNNEKPIVQKKTPVKDAVIKRGTQIIDTIKDTAYGKINPLETGIQAVGAGAGFISDVVGAGIEKITPQPIKNAIGEVANSPVVQGSIHAYNTWKIEHPEAAKNLESVVNIASLLPIGKAGQVGVKAVGEGMEATGKGVSKVGEAVYKSAIPLNEQEAGLLQKFKAGVSEKPRITSDTALEKSFVGTKEGIGIKATKAAEDLWKGKIAPAVKGIKERITKDELFGEVEKRINKISDASRKKSLKDALSAIKDDYKGVKDFSYEKAQKIKSELQEFIPQKAWRGADIAGDYNKIRKLMSDIIREKTYSTLKDVNIKKDYLDYGNLKNLQAFGRKAMTKGNLKGGFGNFWSEIWNITTTPIKTIGGQVLYKAGNGMQFIAPKGIKKMGDYLKTKLKD